MVKSKADLRAARQKKLIERLRKKENWMKWSLIGTLILVILLLLFLGYVTDWGMGLKKPTTPLQPDSSQATESSQNNGTAGSGRSSGQSSTNTTTRSSTTTTERLFSETNLGGNIQDTIDSANQMGVGVDCTDQIVVKECTFTGGDQTITTKSVSDVITSVVEQ